MRQIPCPDCNGDRLKPLSLAVTIDQLSIADLCNMSIKEAATRISKIKLNKRDKLIAEPILKEINSRMGFLLDVGLEYLSLHRAASTLSGGEAQRVKLAKELARRSSGSTLYILDEPTTGLHFHDIKKLLEILHELVEKGNTVIVIEHNLDVIKTADYVIDIGPEGGDKVVRWFAKVPQNILRLLKKVLQESF